MHSIIITYWLSPSTHFKCIRLFTNSSLYYSPFICELKKHPTCMFENLENSWIQSLSLLLFHKAGSTDASIHSTLPLGFVHSSLVSQCLPRHSSLPIMCLHLFALLSCDLSAITSFHIMYEFKAILVCSLKKDLKSEPKCMEIKHNMGWIVIKTGIRLCWASCPMWLCL